MAAETPPRPHVPVLAPMQALDWMDDASFRTTPGARSSGQGLVLQVFCNLSSMERIDVAFMATREVAGPVPGAEARRMMSEVAGN